MYDQNGKKIVATVPFFDGECNAIVAMPISFNFMDEMIGCTRVALGMKRFDLLGIPGFSKRVSLDSKTVLDTITLAVTKHLVRDIVIFQHMDFHNDGNSTRFVSRLDEDYYHKRILIDAAQKIKTLYPEINVALIYARIVKSKSEIEFSKIFQSGNEEVCLRTPFLFGKVNTCGNTVIQCLDYRFRAETRQCIQNAFGVEHFNIIGLPGSTKSFLEGSMTAWKGIKMSYEKHGCRRFFIVHHEDCGAYGSSRSFVNPEKEEAFHNVQLCAMRDRLVKMYTDVDVILIYAKLIGTTNRMIQFIVV